MFLFYSSDVQENHVYLTEEEHRHCTKVLRKKLGDIINCTDGLGHQFQTRINSISKTKTELEIIEKTSHPVLKPSLHIAVALPKSSSRVDFMFEKLVETGAQTITPILTAHSERKKLNIERYRKKLISASTQSLKYHFPILNDSTPLKTLIADSSASQVLVAHFNKDNQHLTACLSDLQDTLILIGPEGDFSASELEEFKAQEYQFVNLSQHRLRTETAAIAASIIFNSGF